MQAAESGLPSQVAQYLAQFRQLQSELAAAISGQEEQAPGDLLYLDRLAVMEQEILAGMEYARGENEKAISLAAEASRLEGEMPFSFGPPFVDLPPAEYLGDLLRGSRQYVEAALAYEVQLERTRQKPRALLGLSLALAGQEDKEVEVKYVRARLERIWEAADDSVKQPD